MQDSTLVTVKEVVKRFGGIVALNGVSCTVRKGEILGIIGPNGAGKTTLLNVINGVYPPDRGEVYFQSMRLDGLPAYKVAHQGISRTFQISRIFRRMSVLENMLSSSIHSLGKGPQALRRAEELLNSVGLVEVKDHYAYELSGGQQKLLEFARALMPDPQLILMDEPFAGVHPTVKELLFNGVREMNQGQGKTFILISHDIKSIRDLCHRLVVLNFGEKVMEGPTGEVLSNPEVIEAYLGREAGVP